MVQTLPSLVHLALHSDSALEGAALVDGFPLSIATSCSQLRHLDICDAELGSLPPEIGHLTRLTRLRLVTTGIKRLPATFSQLTALRELDVSWNEDLQLPRELTACRQLTRLEMESDHRSPFLAKLQTLRRLRLSLIPNPRPRTTYWTKLTGLTELSLVCIGGSIPAGLGSMTSLRKICVSYAAVDDLPLGPYLSSLESLLMDHCTFSAGVPANLAGATQLRHLTLKDRNTGIELTAADVALLRSLPALANLSIGKPVGIADALWKGRIQQVEGICNSPD